MLEFVGGTQYEILAARFVKELENDTKPNLLEIGCGVGNFIFPLISEGTAFFIHACDFSPRAIDLVKENDLYNTDICNAFVCDVTKDMLTEKIPPDSVDVATMIFVLSAIHPDKMHFVLKNVFEDEVQKVFLEFATMPLVQILFVCMITLNCMIPCDPVASRK
ncbi:tRNA N(3)-methylcytidine methyltransferase METTL6 [Trichonephila clavipes]|nr:tRNA N(3)-methylcytidine methyltransferase METTL6 [Trichonephila clavipes]